MFARVFSHCILPFLQSGATVEPIRNQIESIVANSSGTIETTLWNKPTAFVEILTSVGLIRTRVPTLESASRRKILGKLPKGLINRQNSIDNLELPISLKRFLNFNDFIIENIDFSYNFDIENPEAHEIV